MRLIQSVSLFVISLTAALHGQNILGQYTVPYPQPQTGPYFVVAQFATPDGSGGLFYFDPSANTLHRFDSTGKELWNTSLSFGSSPSSQSLVDGLAVAADGVYLGGHTNGALAGQTNAGSYDPFLVKYDLTGKMLWARQFGTAAAEYVRAIALGPNGVYVLGVVGQTNSSIFIYLIDPSGNEVWTRNFIDPVLFDVIGASADATGVYFFGYTGPAVPVTYNVLRKFDAGGNDLWTYQFDKSSIILGAAPDGQGVYVEFFPSGGDPDLSVRRLDPKGSETWTRDIVPSFSAGAIAADATGFYLAGMTYSALSGQCYAGQGDIFLMRFDTSGFPLWTREWGTAGGEGQASIAIGASSVDVSGFSGQTTFVTTIEKSSTAPSQPAIHNECVLNAANYLGGGVAPGEIVTILGSAMGPSDLVKLQPAADGQIPTTLAGARILFNGEPAPLIYVSDQQSSAIVPYDLAGKSSVSVQVEYNGVQSSPVVVPVFDARLGVFSFGPNGTGQAAIINEGGTVNSPFNPAAAGSLVSIYATGGGLTTPMGADNQITGANLMPIAASAYVRLETDGSCDAPYYPAAVSYYGGAPESVPGLVQINAQLPEGAPVGDAVPLFIGLNSGTVEQMVTIAIR
jgi:uncharacterized protein (TIGR03437 family)